MEALGKVVCRLMLFFVGIFGLIFYVAPVCISIYNMTMFPVTGIVINELFFLGIFTLKVILWNKIETKEFDLKDHALKIVFLWIVVGFGYVLANFYVWILR